MRDDLIAAVLGHQVEFGLELTEPQINKLADYFALVQEHNPLLHLVAPCSPEEFAVRHILESLALLKYLPRGAKFADVGTGAGLPSIPCLLVRNDLSAILIESKEKKARYLEEATKKLGIDARTEIINKQFEEARDLDFSSVTCRALDKFTEKLPRLVKWTKGRPMLLFGGKALGEAITRQNLKFTDRLMPMSEQRYLYVVAKGGAGIK
jgi:16S rRNA (guanine527-N7)-methyltransferase